LAIAAPYVIDGLIIHLPVAGRSRGAQKVDSEDLALEGNDLQTGRHGPEAIGWLAIIVGNRCEVLCLNKGAK